MDKTQIFWWLLLCVLDEFHWKLLGSPAQGLTHMMTFPTCILRGMSQGAAPAAALCWQDKFPAWGFWEAGMAAAGEPSTAARLFWCLTNPHSWQAHSSQTGEPLHQDHEDSKKRRDLAFSESRLALRTEVRVGDFPGGQRLRLGDPSAEDSGSIPGGGTRSYVTTKTRHSQLINIKEEKKWEAEQPCCEIGWRLKPRNWEF